AAGQPLRRSEGQGTSDRGHRRLDARADRNAAHRRSRRHPGRGRQAGRHLQHGRCRRRQLRVHPRKDQMKPSAIVTGGASGIGLATAEWLLDDGWPVAILDSDPMALVAAEDMFSGENAVFIGVDVTDEEMVAEAFDQAVDALGPLGGLVNSAGIAMDVSFMETTAEKFREVLDVNLVGTLIASKAAVERMAETLAIVNIASVSGLRANQGRCAYGASKAGVRLMSEVM